MGTPCYCTWRQTLANRRHSSAKGGISPIVDEAALAPACHRGGPRHLTCFSVQSPCLVCIKGRNRCKPPGDADSGLRGPAQNQLSTPHSTNIPARHAQGEQHEHAEVCCGDLACLPAEFHRQPRPDLESLTSPPTWEAKGEETRCLVSPASTVRVLGCVCALSPRLAWCLLAKWSAAREQKANSQP